MVRTMSQEWSSDKRFSEYRTYVASSFQERVNGVRAALLVIKFEKVVDPLMTLSVRCNTSM